jgi:PAS domain S-box-containing protein
MTSRPDGPGKDGQIARLARAGELAAIAVAFVIAARLSLRFASINPSATPIWPPTGLVLGLMLIRGYRIWPAVMAGSIVANYPTAGWLSLIIGVGNTLEALAGTWLLNRFAEGVKAFRTPGGVAKFAVAVCGVAAPISATVGALSLTLGGRAGGSSFADIWTTWWLGDTAGGLVVAPAVVLWVIEPPRLTRPFRPPIGCLIAIVLSVAVGMLAMGPTPRVFGGAEWPVLAMIPLLWGALRGSERDTATAAVILSGFAVYATAIGSGPFLRPTLNDTFLQLVAFMVSVALPSLALSAGMASRGRALAASEENYRLLVDAIRDYAIFMVGADGTVATWNSGSERIYGYSASEVIGQPVAKLHAVGDEEIPSELFQRAAETGRAETEGWRVRRDGSRFWAHILISAIRDERGGLLGFAKITRDVTEQREAQLTLERTREQLLQAQKLEALGHLTGGVAHDFNNLLMVVGGQAELLSRRPHNQAQLKSLDAIKTAVARGSSLTRQLLSFARRQTLNPQVIDPSVRLREMRSVLQSSLGEAIELELDIEAGVWPIEVDVQELELALLNLAVNAKDAMPGGGKVRIGVRNLSLEVQPARRDMVEISVSDTGEGMSPEVLERVFDPFYTTKPVGKGTGLGLSQVHGFATQAGGEASARSRLGMGSTILLRLPRAAGLPVAEHPPKPRVRLQATGKVLLVEDNADVADVTSKLLQRLGSSVVVAASGASALDRLERGDRFDLLLSDIVMPGPIDGLALARRVRDQYPDLPVVLTTGFSQASEALPPGVALLQKPFDADELSDALAAALRSWDRSAASSG